jgi:hypothetical protein
LSHSASLCFYFCTLCLMNIRISGYVLHISSISFYPSLIVVHFCSPRVCVLFFLCSNNMLCDWHTNFRDCLNHSKSLQSHPPCKWLIQEPGWRWLAQAILLAILWGFLILSGLQHQSSIGCSVRDFLFQFYFQRQNSNIIQVLDYLVFLEIAQTRPSMILECCSQVCVPV